MNISVRIEVIPGPEAAAVVDSFYEQEAKAHRARPEDIFFAAFLGARVVGACRFCIEENTPMLRSMVVHAPLRSQKIGSQILKTFEQYLVHNDSKSTYCIPYRHLENFYGTIGFRMIQEKEAPWFLQERIQGYRKRNPEEFIIMRRD